MSSDYCKIQQPFPAPSLDDVGGAAGAGAGAAGEVVGTEDGFEEELEDVVPAAVLAGVVALVPSCDGSFPRAEDGPPAV